MPCALVTGAGGFVGRFTVRAFLASGWRVRAAVRRVPEDAEADVEWRAVGNIEQPNVWQGLTHGVQCVVHLAARAHILRESAPDAFARFRAVNVQPTIRLASEAARTGVRRFIFLSSVGVNGRYTVNEPFRETDEPRPRTPYAMSKWEAEQALQEIAGAQRLQWVIVRAPLVYGPSAPGNFGRLAKWVMHGWPLPLGDVHNKRSILYVENLAHALLRCAEHPAAANQLFLIADEKTVSTPELISRMAGIVGRPTRLWRVPEPALRIAVSMTGDRLRLTSLLDSLEVDCKRVYERIGWVPPYSLAEGLKKTFASDPFHG